LNTKQQWLARCSSVQSTKLGPAANRLTYLFHTVGKP
jgi:hypothetical protein